MTGMIAAFEGMVMGAKAGLDPQTMLDIINVSTGRNSATLEKIPQRILSRKFGGHIATGVKDLGLYISELEELGVPVVDGDRARSRFSAKRSATASTRRRCGSSSTWKGLPEASK